MPFVDESKVTEWTNRLKSYFALLTHKHDASDITSGTLTVSQGGTGGTTALDARKNLSVPVDSSIAYVESTTATKNHAVGDYFMLGSVLMKATAAIATGEQITASKATPVTIQSQIDTLRDSVSQENCSQHVALANNVTINNKILYKYGKVAILTLNGSLSNISVGWNAIAAIGVGYRPLMTFRGIASLPFPSLRDSAVDADGTIRIYAMESHASADFRLTVVYMME